MKKNKIPEVSNWKHKFAKRFEKIREDTGLTQSEMADQLGMSQNLIYRSEKDCDISLNSFLLVVVHYIKNYKMNTEWFFAEDNQGIEPYEIGLKKIKRQASTADRKRNKIIMDMFTALKEEGLIPSETNNSEE